MTSSTISRLPALMLLLLQVLPLAVHSRSSVPLLKVQLHEQRISEHKDSGYVRQIMRQAKAAEMRNYMQQDADACDNFFEFACGNWKKIYPDDGPIAKETNFFELLTDTYTKKQSKYLEQGKQQNDTAAETKVKDFYASCMQSGGRNKLQQYKMKLREIIAEFGVMPALVKEEIWQEAVVKFDWLETIAKIQNKYGFDIILQLSIRRDFNNRTLNKLFIGPPSLFLQTKSMYQNAETNYHRKQYEKAIKKNLMLQLDMTDELASVTASDILAFETKLAEGLPSLRTDKTLKSKSVARTLDEIQSAYAPTFDLKQYLVTALSHEPNATFYEYNAQYQENLVQVIQHSNKEQLANYIYYQLLIPFFYNVEDTAVRRKKVCFEKTLTSFAKVLDSAIFKRYNTAATERDVNLIWQMIKETFLEELESDKLHWISTNTRKLAAEKLQAMQLEINSYAQQDLNAEYAELQIDNRNFIQNLKAVRSFETKRFLKSLYEVPKPTESALMLSYSPAYLSVENLIKIPVSLLQPNYLWSDHYPNALKFGTLGYLIAHELIHGFDDLGRNYDIDGNDFNWWDTNSTEAFNERKQCFKSQYARYRYGGKYLPESDLQAENIADNGAIQVAFRAYMRWLNAAEAQLSSTTTNDTVSVNSTTTPTTSKQSFIIERLPNLNFTNKQLFFISFAQFWCNDINDLLKDKVSLNDVHAPAMFRVIGPLANFIEFSNQFQCAKGTTMNPEKKCQIY